MAAESDGSSLAAAGPRPWSGLRDSGLLWLINRTALHPRGFALGITEDGWTLLGDGSEPWMFLGADEEDACFARLEAFLDQHRMSSLPPRPAP